MGVPEVLVDAEALVHNFKLLQRLSGQKSLMPVVKANAYGHDSVLVGTHLEKEFFEKELPYFCVARVCEARDLRKGGLQRSILVLSHFSEADFESEDFPIHTEIVVSSEADVELLTRLSNRALKRIQGVHVNLNTGMNRLGFAAKGLPEQNEKILAMIGHLWNLGLPVQGIMTHLARSEEKPALCTESQVELFESCVGFLRREWKADWGSFPRWLHLSNSASIPRSLGTQSNAVRPGIFLWGSFQDFAHQKSAVAEFPELQKLKPVMRVRSPLRQIFWIEAGELLGYGHRFKASRKSCIATLSLGYADGIWRKVSRRESDPVGLGFVVRGTRLPILGSVSMDMTMVDLTDHPARDELSPADWAYWISPEQGAMEIAATLQTISYEVFCSLDHRLPRRYLDEESLR